MRLEEMNYFVEIVNAKSINQAAKALFVAQPALSRMLASLEKELGFPLLTRTQQGITPTKEGLEVYTDCLQILALYTNCMRKWNDLAYASSNLELVVPIVALPMACNSTMNQVLYQVGQKYPHIHLELYEKQLSDILETTASLPHAIGISHYNDKTRDKIHTFAKHHQMQITPLFDDEYKLFASCDNPLTKKTITLTDLQDCTLATYSNFRETTQQPMFVEAGLTDIAHFKHMLYLSNRYAMYEVAAANQALSLAALHMTREDVYRQSGKVKALEIKNFYLPMTYFLFYHQDATIEEKIVIDLLLTSFKKLSEKAL